MYLRTWFLLDLVSSLPLQQMAGAFGFDENSVVNPQPAKLLKFGKIAKVLKVLKVRRASGRNQMILLSTVSPGANSVSYTPCSVKK